MENGQGKICLGEAGHWRGTSRACLKAAAKHSVVLLPLESLELERGHDLRQGL